MFLLIPTLATTLFLHFCLFQFLLEDARNRSSMPEAPTAYIRRPSSGSIGRPTSAPSGPPEPLSAETTVVLPLRRQIKPPEDKGS